MSTATLTTPIDPARFACEALKLKPMGEPSEEAFVCRMSGYRHEAGTPAVKPKFGIGFMDAPDLDLEADLLISGYAAALMPKPILFALHNTFVTRDGVFKIAKYMHRRHFLENMPEPPFLVCCGAGTNAQHVAWKTPVSHSKDAFMVRVGPRLWPVVMSKVHEFTSKVVEGKSPLLVRDGRLNDLSCGQPNPKWIKDGTYPPEMFANLGPGEWWAIAAMLYDKGLEAPEPVSIKTKN